MSDSTTPRSEFRVRRSKVLVVDDEKSIRFSLREFLTDAGYEVGMAKDADQAMGMLAAADFDVVLADIILPRVTGVDLLKAIQETWPHVRVILMTGEPTVETASEGVRAGALDYLAKPIGKEQLLKAVANAAKVKALEDERQRLTEENRAYQENLERLVELRTAALGESRERMELALAGADLGTWDWNAETDEVTFNERLVGMLGYEPDELEPKFSTWTNLIHPDDSPGVREVLDSHLEGRTESYETEHRLRHKSGHWVWVLDKGRVVERNADGKPLRMCGTHLDITERKRAEAELRESEARASAVLDTTVDGIITINERGIIESFNLAAEDLFDYTAAEAIGQNVMILMPSPYREEHDGYLRNYLETRQPKIIGIGREVIGQRKDGSTFPIDIALSEFTFGSQPKFTGVIRDITERKRAEEVRLELEAQLQQSQKMEAIGFLASGITHEFSNLLMAITGHVALAKMTLDENHEAIQSLEKVEEAAEQATGVTRDLLTFSRKAVAQKAPLNLSSLVLGSVELWRHAIPRAIELVREVESTPAIWVNADETQIQQVLANLITNGQDAMSKGGELRVMLRRVSGDGSASSPNSEAETSDVAVLVVEDTGCGMSDETTLCIFEPFFTTKPREKGTGLGLSIVHGIIADHGGRITVESQEGIGTRFIVSIPCCEAEEESSPASKEPPAQTGHGETIMLVEDNEYVRSLMSSFVLKQGYQVIPIKDGEQAMTSFRENLERVAAVVLDLDLPKKSGLSCLQEMREARPDVPVIITTGSGDADLDDLSSSPGTYVLRKPFRLTELIKLLNQCCQLTATSELGS